MEIGGPLKAALAPCEIFRGWVREGVSPARAERESFCVTTCRNCDSET